MAEEPRACEICGTFNCSSCIGRLEGIREEGYQPKDEFRKIAKFREQVRNASRKNKRNMRLL